MERISGRHPVWLSIVFSGVLASTFTFSGSSFASTEAENQVDILVSNPTISYRDPEWSTRDSELAFCGEDGRINILRVNPRTGALRPPGVTGSAILGECKNTGNGPEWGYARGVTLLSWVVEIDGKDNMAMASRPGAKASWAEVNPLPSSESMRGAFPIRNSAARPWVVYSKNNATRTFARPPMKPYDEVAVVDRSKFPKWVPGTDEIIYTTALGSIESIDVLDETRREWVPATGESLKNPIAWQPPELSYPAVAVINDTNACIQVYQIAPAVTPSKEICADQFGETAEISSPEVFVVKNRSYISFTVSWGDSLQRHIYVAGAIDLAAEPPFIERTSSSEERRRKDPEPFVSGDRAWIYYTAAPGTDLKGPRGIWKTDFFGR